MPSQLPAHEQHPPPGTLGEVAALFLKLGTIAFGGPVAHIAMMRDEVVTRRRWVTDQQFLDLLGATNLIPGPNSTEMAIHLGFVRAGWRGLVVAGSLFILPAMLIVIALAWLYVQYGSTPGAGWLLYGIKPVIIAIVAQALWGLLKTAVKGPLHAIVGAGVLALYLLGFNEILLLFGGGLLVMLLENGLRDWRARSQAASFVPLFGAGPLLAQIAAQGAYGLASFNLWTLFLTFLKIGAVLYGSGYVLLAFLRNDFVERLGWLTNQQLLDAVAVGQLTPGPFFTTATFIGYLLGGLPGALVATLGIFLPSCVFVAVSGPFVRRLRRSRWSASLLDGVNVAALGLMLGVTWELGRSALVDLPTVLIAVVAWAALLRFKVNSAWLVLAGGGVGLVGFMLSP
ncbi:MAG TPA: chromate transporter [Chloroflexia bacterium]|nr:chromate transporter [Chloroflexia bacterium]